MRLFTAFSIAVALATAGLSAEQAAPKSKNPSAAPRQAGDAAKDPMGSLSISGNPSTLVACVGGKFYNSHSLGFATTNTRISIDVLSGDGIDPTAALTLLQMGGHHPDGQARASFAYDDDSGGGRDPHIDFTVPYDGHVVLNVGSFDGAFGCYWVKVTVTPS